MPREFDEEMWCPSLTQIREVGQRHRQESERNEPAPEMGRAPKTAGFIVLGAKDRAPEHHRQTEGPGGRHVRQMIMRAEKQADLVRNLG